MLRKFVLNNLIICYTRIIAIASVWRKKPYFS